MKNENVIRCVLDVQGKSKMNKLSIEQYYIIDIWLNLDLFGNL